MAYLAENFIPVLFHLLLCVHRPLVLSFGNPNVTVCTEIFRPGSERHFSFFKQAPVSYTACNKTT
jgi:hypothetical protein